MISVEEVIQDPDFTAPQPYQVLRSTGEFVSGGFDSATFTLSMFGPVQQASNKEIAMLPEADRVGSIRSFWSVVPIYLTRGTAPAPSVHGEAPQGAVPGTVYTLSGAPPAGVGDLYINGLRQTPGADYVVLGNIITTTTLTAPNDKLWFSWPVTVDVQQSASDIIIYPPGGERYRVLQRYFDPGSGYWKALGTRMNAA